jgi:dTDP-4-dehydrorhamnose reductase
MRVLLTGSTGLLGGMLVYEWRHVVDLIACVHERKLVSDGFAVRTLDVRDRDGVVGIVRETRPDWICHVAAATNVDLCETDPQTAEELNVTATATVSEAASKFGARFLLISTDSVFDGHKGSYNECDAPNPLNVYAKSKLAAEDAARRSLPGSLIVRTNIFGWNLQPKAHLVEWIISQLRTARRVPGWVDVFFTPMFTGDLAGILMEMMVRSFSGTYHAAGSARCSKFEFARAVATTWRFDADLVDPTTSEAAGLKARRPKDTSLMVGKLSCALGRELPGLSSGLRRMCEWEGSNLVAFKNLLA